jgi:hypothetical protein
MGKEERGHVAASSQGVQVDIRSNDQGTHIIMTRRVFTKTLVVFCMYFFGYM